MINVKFEVKTIEEQIQVIKSFLSSKNQTSKFIAEFFGFDTNCVKSNDIKIKLTKLYNERVEDLKISKEKFQKVWNSI